ncbi:MAG: PAS domain-containing protein [Deltaproteobacteria bacterium]|nr:PAS domain-containing protein [Deltaproteobacteria bacterium]
MLRQVVLLIGPNAGCDDVRAALHGLPFAVGMHCPSFAELPPPARLGDFDVAVCIAPTRQADALPDQALDTLSRVPTVFVVPEASTGEVWGHTPELMRHGYGLLTEPVRQADLLWEIEVAKEKWRTSENLRDRSALNRVTLRAIRDAVLTIDKNEAVLFMNQAAEDMTGVPLQEALGQHFGDVASLFAVGEATRAHLVDLAQLREPAIDSGDGSFVLRRADGGERHVRASLSPIEVQPGPGASAAASPAATSGFVLVLRDVTEERRLQNQVILMDRLASVGTLAAGIAHEINNPLACVVSNVEFAAERAAAAEQLTTDARVRGVLADLKAALADAAFGAERAAKVVQNMRALAGTGGGTVDVIDVSAAVASAVRLTAHELPAGAEVATELAPGLCAEGDQGSLIQVLVNLLVNASHAVAARGAQARVSVAVREAEEQVLVTVTDNGTGMAPEIAARIFDPFFTTKPPGKGTGLGLAIAHTLITRMHGRVEVHSTLDVGTTFSLWRRLSATCSRTDTRSPER